MTILEGKSILLVVTGGIAAYKTPELVRKLKHEQADVRVAMTQSATRFVTPLTMQTLTLNPVAMDLWTTERPHEVEHISLADWAHAAVIAPATANMVGKLANGLADDFVSTLLLALRVPILICPSMNVNMFEHPSVQANLEKLGTFTHVLEPDSGDLACGWEGKGRLPDNDLIIEELKGLLSPRDLAGRTVMVTAGPTREPWDDIRFISNRSTGLMGLSLAREARRRGARVIMVAGPIDTTSLHGVEIIPVESTLDMLTAVKDNISRADILIKAAAPGDFRPAARTRGKVKKDGGIPSLELTRNPDILKEIAQLKKNRLFIGFAAEADNLLENARAKRAAKHLDLIVANRIGSPTEAFGSATNRVWLIDRHDQVDELPLMPKEDVARHILDRVVRLLPSRDCDHA
jgi:phosphopantothenoylcysteine decarboxylase / phosphopantothenate---cysteine ligase